jgi:hypothetical protein
VVGWGVQQGDSVLVGDGVVALRDVRIEVRRTWRPTRMPDAGLRERVPGGGPGGRWQVAAVQLATDALAGRGTSGAVAALVGAGPGLTPSGDDALCGVMLGLRLAGRQEAVGRVWDDVRPRLGATTTLSASLLREAVDGYALPDLVRLGEALVAGDRPAVTDATRGLAAVGHTSGLDLLAGFWGALEAAGLATASAGGAAPAVSSEGGARP